MVKRLVVPFLFIIICFAGFLHAEHRFVHHGIQVEIQPGAHTISVKDRISFPGHFLKDKKKIHFLLHGNLALGATPKNVTIRREKGPLKSEFFGINTASFEIKKKIPLHHYSLTINDNSTSVVLSYSGKIHHPIKQVGAEYARGFSQTPGIVDKEGSYLAGASFWVPWFDDGLVTFKLETVIPEPYDTVSQGNRMTHKKVDGKQLTTWDSPEPMDEIYLSAAKFTEYGIKVGKVDILAFLRSNDQGLANKYLETTGQYLEMYEKLIGPYPYSKFALIENFWETGYGMPSFTLLGPKIIRFPFILHSSYPHELLHNWWGNSVFVDYEKGNWCEGLTAFMADHLIKEQRGQGAAYRKTTLQGYTHYAAGKKEEFPLTQFKARYNALSSSIGYGKTLMVFNMLRLQTGDKLFTRALQHFYKNNKYKRATFDDIRVSFETVTGNDFKSFFSQWVTRTGVPELKLDNVEVKQQKQSYSLQFSLHQLQKGDVYRLNVPAAISLKGEKTAVIKMLDMSKKNQNFSLTFSKLPVSVDIDPAFHLCRKLHTNEIPATLSSAFGAQSVLMVLPSDASPQMQEAYRKLADNWAKESKGKIKIKSDKEVKNLPKDGAVWLLGWENRHKAAIETGIKGFPAAMDNAAFTIAKKKLTAASKSIITAIKNPDNPSQVIVLLSSDRVSALPGLGRKLPHYGKYSYLAFEGDEPNNMFKGQWPAINSPLSFGKVKSALPNEVPLARLAPLFSAKRLMKHVTYLASKQLAGRQPGTKGIDLAALYIVKQFKASGLKPLPGSDSYMQTWEAEVGKEKKKLKLNNIIGLIPGKNPKFKDQAAVICAHYDHLGRGWPDVHKGDEGKIHYGADDNASGTSILMELAHILGKSLQPERSILFIAFTAEESGLLGSKYFVDQLKQGKLAPFKTVNAVVNMDSVGRLSDKEKLMVIGGSSAREWKFIFMGIGYTVGIETSMVSQDLDASDQVSFIKAGIPGVQLFSGPHTDYHRPGDTVDKVDAAGLVKVAAVAKEAIVYLSERPKPLAAVGTAPKKKDTGTTASSGGRRVRTGIMPDFAFSGTGVKIGFVSPGSPVHKAGLRKGDIVIKLGAKEVTALKAYSNELKKYKPGDKVTMTYVRDGKTKTVTITLGAR